MKFNDICERLKVLLTEKRYIHSVNVANCAKEMAKLYGADEEKAYIAGMVHDCAKYFNKEKRDYYVDKYHIEMDDMEKRSGALAHSVIGAYVTKYIFEIDDEEILGAVRYHTTGNVNMSLMEKIIYLADVIEVGRDYPGVDELRELVYSGKLDEALLKSFDNTISLMIKKGNTIHPRSVAARNFIIEEMQKK
ncbi:HD domain-containing protein [Peptacetobacter hominis]|uniref:bis(5'-nucleosyl)-tetraphosphatase (symmetrical) n=1 Tax=Peptacetobacter hominis TaxID=2743610 RepID=A0A544QYA0_9FIRM|nr:bis(5'-nucleosyl)-tetraphosphatase (symmetrical) YqeK [Peptacetobacter hominis]TQQ85651.1 HD domain-containing protein [Peptacetobacter hominis]